ncbi:MAG: hypothetical protein Q8888_02130 [Vigna little leaf phytoplasma]|nr:hypothetical protein [Vigna little leaf phytoplasma]
MVFTYLPNTKKVPSKPIKTKKVKHPVPLKRKKMLSSARMKKEIQTLLHELETLVQQLKEHLTQ